MIPNFFSKLPLPEKLPDSMEVFLEVLKQSGSKRACLEQAYEFLCEKYYGGRGMTYVKFCELWTTDVKTLRSKGGFLHCTNMNWLLRILLIKSGWFTEDDIQLAYAFVYYVSPHQYLKIRVAENEGVNVDLWGHTFGIPFGERAHGFNI